MAQSSKKSKASGNADKCAKSESSESAEQHFKNGVLTRGEAVPSVKGSSPSNLPPGVTHEVAQDEQGNTVLKRRRFSAY